MDDGFQRELDREFAKWPRFDDLKVSGRVFLLVVAAWIACLVVFGILIL